MSLTAISLTTQIGETKRAIDTLCKPNIQWTRGIGEKSGPKEIKEAWGVIRDHSVSMLSALDACPFVLQEAEEKEGLREKAVRAILFHAYPYLAYNAEEKSMVSPYVAARIIMGFLKTEPAGIDFYKSIDGASDRAREVLEFNFAMSFANQVVQKLNDMLKKDNSDFMSKLRGAFDMVLQAENEIFRKKQ